MVGSRALAVVLVACATWGCGDETFECRSDANCQSAGMAGVCQPDGYCSFPDDTCPSGQRYGEFAGNGKAGTCVPPGDAAGTGGEATSSMSGSGSGPTSSSGSAGTTMGVEVGPSEGSTAATSDATTGSATSETDVGSVTDDAGSTTGATTRECKLLDDFEAAAIDMTVWEWWSEDGVVVEQVDGVLRMTLDPTTSAMGGMRTQVGDLTGHEVELEVGTIPNQAVGTEQTLILADDNGVDVRLTLTDGDVVLTTWSGASNEVLYAEAAPIAPEWRFRLTFEAGALLLEHKDGPGTWDEVWEGESPIATTDVMLVLRALTFDATAAPGVAEFDEISACATD